MRAREVEVELGRITLHVYFNSVYVRVHVLPVYVSLVLRVCPGLPSPSPTDSINIESLGA